MNLKENGVVKELEFKVDTYMVFNTRILVEDIHYLTPGKLALLKDVVRGKGLGKYLERDEDARVVGNAVL